MNFQPGSLLILEDHPAMLTYYRDILRDEGYILLMAASVADAKQIYDQNRASVRGIISDGHVIGMETGDSFVEYVRKNGFTGPVIAASVSLALREAFIKAGATAFTTEKTDAPPMLLKQLPRREA